MPHPIKQLRQTLGQMAGGKAWSQNDLGDYLNLSGRAVRKWENDEPVSGVANRAISMAARWTNTGLPEFVHASDLEDDDYPMEYVIRLWFPGWIAVISSDPQTDGLPDDLPRVQIAVDGSEWLVLLTELAPFPNSYDPLPDLKKAAALIEISDMN